MRDITSNHYTTEFTPILFQNYLNKGETRKHTSLVGLQKPLYVWVEAEQEQLEIYK